MDALLLAIRMVIAVALEGAIAKFFLLCYYQHRRMAQVIKKIKWLKIIALLIIVLGVYLAYTAYTQAKDNAKQQTTYQNAQDSAFAGLESKVASLEAKVASLSAATPTPTPFGLRKATVTTAPTKAVVTVTPVRK